MSVSGLMEYSKIREEYIKLRIEIIVCQLGINDLFAAPPRLPIKEPKR